MIDLLTTKTVADIGGDEAIVLDEGSAWQIACDLLIDGPFHEALLVDAARHRWVTASSLMRAAVRRAPTGCEPLEPDDFDLAHELSPSLTIMDAAIRMAHHGCDRAICVTDQITLVTSQALFRALRTSPSAMSWMPSDQWP